MKARITASGVISPQHTHNTEGFPSEIITSVTNQLTCIEPDYKELINPLQLRRMPRILKMGLAASQLCINRAGGVRPDGIIIGTGLGCLDNLEKFLLEVLNSKEHVTSVLAFINSTHNAVAAQIAMMLKNHNYNLTYCHRSFSFESALQDALMLLADQQAENVLIGGVDESTSDFIHLHQYLNWWKEPHNCRNLLSSGTPGTIAGEGAAFFILSGNCHDKEPAVCLEDVHTFFTPRGASVDDVRKETDWFIHQCGLDGAAIDGIMFGLNGDAPNDRLYYDMMKQYGNDHISYLYYKHLCGEYYTSGAFSLWLGATVMKNGEIPQVIKLNKGNDRPLKNLLLYNHFRNTEHSLMLLSYE